MSTLKVFGEDRSQSILGGDKSTLAAVSTGSHSIHDFNIFNLFRLVESSRSEISVDLSPSGLLHQSIRPSPDPGPWYRMARCASNSYSMIFRHSSASFTITDSSTALTALYRNLGRNRRGGRVP